MNNNEAKHQEQNQPEKKKKTFHGFRLEKVDVPDQKTGKEFFLQCKFDLKDPFDGIRDSDHQEIYKNTCV